MKLFWKERLNTDEQKIKFKVDMVELAKKVGVAAMDASTEVCLGLEVGEAWPPDTKNFMASFLNFNLGPDAFWKGNPLNVDVLPLARDVMLNGLDTEPGCSCMLGVGGHSGIC